MRKRDGIREIDKKKLNRMDYLRKVLKEDRTGAVREMVERMFKEEKKRDHN